MASVPFTMIILTLSVLSSEVFSADDKRKCEMIKFENDGKILDAVKGCLNSTKMQMPTGIPSVKTPEEAKKALELFEKSGFDDKCFSKCLVEKFKLVSEGKPNREEAEKLLKNNAPEGFNKIIADIWGGCADKIEAKYKGDVMSDLCKSSAEFAHCAVQNFMDKTDALLQAC